MPLEARQRLGAYEVAAPLGAGGMGEVYRARDSKLGREVAIKVLPEEFTEHPEKLARFEREARLLAALNHPKIATLYGLEEAAGKPFLVMELVEGETLAERIARGPLPLEEALHIAHQIAEALEAAHEKGVIHRDLKPANVKVDAEGNVKVLDFGLAKAFADDEASESELSQSPTLSRDATRAGVILGTAAYMSPEQAKGKAVDKRSDIFSFGIVLYEMLTGKKAFGGEDVPEVLAAIINKEPDLTPVEPRVETLLRRCLRKDRRKRLRDIGDARNEIEEIVAEPAATNAGTAHAAIGRVAAWRGYVVTAILSAGVAGLIVWIVTRPAAPTPRALTRFALSLPASTDIELSGIALSPNGTDLVYVGSHDGVLQLYRRSMDRLESVPISGTEQARYPFFSPEGEWVGFFADNKLMKVSLGGGPPITICDAGTRRGASWGSNGIIVFASDASPGLMRVSASGGIAEPATLLEEGERQHRWLDVLPGGKAVLFTLWSGSLDTTRIAVESLETGERKVLVTGTDPRYVSTGHILFGRANSIWAVPFDSSRLEVTGEPTPVIDEVQVNPGGLASFATAEDGSLAYVPSDSWVRRRVVWVDRDGNEELVVAEPQGYQEFTLSPGGTQIAIRRSDSSTSDLWVYDLVRGTWSRLTFDPDIIELAPVWTPDGQRVAFGGFAPMSWKAADGTGDVEPLFENSYRLEPQAISPDGRLLILLDRRSGLGDLAVLPMESEGTPSPLLNTAFTERNAVLSPDGRYMAYESNESGRFEIYVRPFPDVTAGRWQLSTDGGIWPLWAPDGRELFYVGARDMMSVAVETGPTFRHGAQRALFDTTPYHRVGSFGRRAVAMAPDGRRFLMLKDGGESEDAAAGPNIVVVQNWHEELKRLVPND